MLLLHRFALAASLLLALNATSNFSSAEEDFIPQKQSKAPGPALTPEQSLKKFTVPDGFHVVQVAAEPDIANPVAMAFDDRGRIYVTESFEYPRREAGPGRDRIKILEDTDNDGRADKFTIFAEGLNIPSGIAVGHGGVWVANAPDILFLEDTDGDDRADKQTVVVTGFGRADVHEVPSGLTWGPDGCLYGLNGVFNPSKIQQNGKTWEFTCAMWRIDPRTHAFDLFCEGTSNPWGIAFNSEGSAFISACVIDHLWHLTESAYYDRQGGPYPQHTWKAESIVDHHHQMAAYCGIEYVDTDAYPKSFSDKLYMGNIHGTCINVDRVQRSGATYKGFPEDDFMTADDIWFMPVSQKVGPDGFLYVLDWYDRYHCYQDAMADAKGVDRGLGRLYCVAYGDKPRSPKIDIAKLSNTELVRLLTSPNIYMRQRSQLELCERRIAQEDSDTTAQLVAMTLNTKLPSKHRMHAAWAITGSGPVDAKILTNWLACDDPILRAWGVRTVGSMKGTATKDIIESAFVLAKDPDPRVRVEVAIAVPKLAPSQVTTTLLTVLKSSGEDAILPKVVWQNWYPRLLEDQSQVLAAFEGSPGKSGQLLRDLAPRIANVWMAAVKPSLDSDADKDSLRAVLKLAELVHPNSAEQAAETLAAIIDKTQNGELRGEALPTIINRWFAKGFATQPSPEFIASIASSEKMTTPWSRSIQQLKTIVGDSKALVQAEAIILDPSQSDELRKSNLRTAAIRSPEIISKSLVQVLEQLAENKAVNTSYRDTVFDIGIAKAREQDTLVLIASLPKLPTGIQATIVERMSQRTATALPLLKEIVDGRLRKELVGPNQVRSLAKSNSPQVVEAVRSIWGTVNTSGSLQRQNVVSNFGNYLKWDARGDAKKGLAVFDRICGQCHVMHGRGYEVGPNITANGRGSFEQLVVSIFDPSLVIGDAYKSITVLTKDGQVVTGLLVEKTDQRIVVKLQGNKQEVILAEDIDEMKQNEKSLMPEGIEEQMTRQEMADLFALLSLEGPYDAAQNTTISGTPPRLHKGK